MNLVHASSLLLALLSSSLLKAEILMLKSDTGDQIKAELLNLENDTALLRLDSGDEFPTPLSFLSPDSRSLILSTWSEHITFIDETLPPLNQALGAPLFVKPGKLWNEPVGAVAKRLRLPPESKTPFTSSYRLYTRANYMFAGAHPYTVVAYGDENGRTESFSLIYSNKGDSLSTAGAGEDHFTDNGQKVDRNTLKGAMRYDEKTISDALTKVLGKGTFQRFAGQGSKTVKVERWDWNDHSFLLTHVKEEYVGLRIVKSSFADESGKTDLIKDGEMRKRLEANVVRKDNGDVIIQNIPMVDQGPKGYCAPATFERAMRHAGVSADMYLLATLATTGGGGTNTSKLYDEVAFTTRSKGGRTARKIELKSLEPKKLKRYIEKGVPILWQMCSLPLYNETANKRTRERQKITDWGSYGSKIALEAENNVKKLKERGNYHICMIIGYNEITNELAVSDSWGRRYGIRWIHVSEAEAVSTRGGFVIDL
ncbi:C39 family peptidase [Akkermansiaceae bacterium]|nr:C39 family peptidase [Akkermansiaceae bacterium]